jgi:hypothetical protein
MRSLKLRSLCALLLVAIGTAGCDEFDNLTDINENPNAPTSLAPEFLLPSLIRGLANELVGESNIDLPSASLFAQHAARIQYAGTDRYDLGTDYGADFWDSYWDLTGDPPEGAFVLSQFMLDGAVELGDANQTAVAMILRAYAAHNLTDMYGDVPYFEAVKGASENAVIRPVYDSQSAIYDDLFTQLTAATTMINVGASGFPGGDLIYSGDMDKWRRFGNSLRLRLAMRISEVNPTKAASEAAAAVAAGVMEDDSHSAALWYSASAPDNNPMWLGFVERPGDYRPAAFFIDEMLARNDPRVRMHADATVDGHGQMYRGMPNGYNDDRGFDANGERDFDYVSQVGAWHLRPEAPAFFMEYAETLLLQAEAADRGWISGSAKDFYEAGIAASMRVYADGCAADCGAFDAGRAWNHAGRDRRVPRASDGCVGWWRHRWREQPFADLPGVLVPTVGPGPRGVQQVPSYQRSAPHSGDRRVQRARTTALAVPQGRADLQRDQRSRSDCRQRRERRVGRSGLVGRVGPELRSGKLDDVVSGK